MNSLYFSVSNLVKISVVIVALLGSAPKAYAQSDFAYYGLEPDIVTNYLGSSARNLGYVRVSVELMLASPDHLDTAEHHAPLLRATVIDIFGRQPEAKVKSLTGREEIRRDCLAEMNELMKRETGVELIKDVIFTKYLYQG